MTQSPDPAAMTAAALPAEYMASEAEADDPGQKRSGRIEWIDALKGLGIILVVVGHVLATGQAARIIYFFHMPLFFWISGFIFRPKEDREIRTHVTRRLVIPYISFLMLVTLFDILQSHATGHPTSLPLGDPLRAGALAIYGGSKLSAAYAVFWFPPCLAISTLVLNTLVRRSSGAENKNIGIFAAFVLLSYFVGPYALPLGLNIVPMAVSIMWSGFLTKMIFSKDLNIGWRVLVALIVISAAGLFVCTPMDMKKGVYGTPVATLVTSIAFIVALASVVANLLPRLGRLSFPLVLLGRASLVIMFLHQVINVAVGDGIEGFKKAAICVLLPVAFYSVIRRIEAARILLIGGR
jgi:fucose 4-O-acetylase-like acetyltransferase